ncbi:MAG: hypothetical protein OSB26_10045 [Woeseiaceae bacterium]|nr:hypothetical protein [Woeseiaceae bacterium]
MSIEILARFLIYQSRRFNVHQDSVPVIHLARPKDEFRDIGIQIADVYDVFLKHGRKLYRAGENDKIGDWNFFSDLLQRLGAAFILNKLV